MFTKELIQAVSDWQRGGDTKQKAKRGQALKKEALKLPTEFRNCQLCCFRQLALEKGSLWKLADTLQLPETISAWTLLPEVARELKNGVPPAGLQGIIFCILPPPSSIIVNLDRLYRDHEFQRAIKSSQSSISGFANGMGRWQNSQNEVILEIDSILISDIYELGGYSGTRDELVREIYGPNPTSNNYADFDYLLRISKQKLGACWIGETSKDRVIKKIQSAMPSLRTIKKLQAAPD